MAVASSSSTTDNTVHSVLFLLLLVVLVSSSSSAVTEVAPSSDSDYSVYSSNQSSSSAAHRVGGEVSQLRLRRIREHLKKINKSPVKTIQSLDGDVIDCVISHQQPAFDHPLLMGQKPITEVPPGRPRSGNEHQKNRIEEKEDGSQEMMIEQIWRMGGEECPEGTVPIRRVTEDDILRVSSIWRFGRKKRGRRRRRFVRRDTSDSDHEHAVGYVTGNQYFGGKASINVWAPRVANPYEFSLSQIWVISGSFGGDLNTIEAGWQVSPELYGDNRPRFFTYWTSDAYQSTGCYNLLCSGFIQTNNRIAIGAAISPTSTYRGGQFDITLLIWKDPKHGHWWLEFGNGILVGYWPSLLFTRLRSGGASMVQFGGEAVNTRPGGSHTATQMGSGHYADEGFGKSSYFRNIEVVDWDNSLVPPPSGLKLVADHPNCYDVRGGRNRVWGDYFYYGGPGRSVRCP